MRISSHPVSPSDAEPPPHSGSGSGPAPADDPRDSTPPELSPMVFPCSGPITADVRVAAGAVEIHAEPRDTVEVTILPFESGTTAREAVTATRVEVSPDTLAIAAPESSGWRWRRSPRLRVIARVPAGSTARVRGGAAAITCTGDWSHAKINTASGDTYLERASDDVSVHTASGDVRTGQIGGRLTVRSASGDVTARRVAGTVDITSASGHVQIDDAGADVRMKTASGNVTLGAARHGTVRANTVSGDISIGVASGAGVWLDLSTVAGKTTSNLTMSGDARPAHDLTLQARTVSGNIDVHRASPPAQA